MSEVIKGHLNANIILPSEKSLHRTQNRMAIAIKIVESLKSLGMSENDFSVKMGKSRSEISSWLDGSFNFSIDMLSDIESALQIKLLDTTICETV